MAVEESRTKERAHLLVSLRETFVLPVCNPVQAESEIASAKGRVKPLARLLRCATALRVTAPPRLRLKAAGMAEREPFGPSTRPEAIQSYQMTYMYHW